MAVDFLYREACPSHEEAYERCATTLAEEGLTARSRRIEVSNEEQAVALRALTLPHAPGRMDRR